MIALDTNVLVYAVAEDDPHHVSSRRLLDAVVAGLVSACVFPQILLEFYAVATDPRRMTRPLTVAQAVMEMANLRAVLPVVMPKENSLDRVFELAASSHTRAAGIFDVFLVAQLLEDDIATICTYNTRDFAAFPVSAATPEEILSALAIPPNGCGVVQEEPGCG